MNSYYRNEENQLGMSNENPTTTYEDTTYNKVLLIEDNPGDARLVELLLAESDLLNCKITNKVTLSEGLESLKTEGDFAAILLDLTLPDSRGFETLERLLEKYPDNNVIVLTGLSDKSLGLKAVQAGAQDFLIKGAFDADLLAKSLRYSIERSSVLKRLEESQKIAHIGNWEFNPRTKEFTASDEVYRIFSLSARKNKMSYEEFSDPDSPAYLFHVIHEETLTHKSVKKDVDICLHDGTNRYVFIQCTTNKNIRGEMVLNGIVQDITERKETEQEMIKSQERYQDIFTRSRDAIYICNMEGRLIDFNKATVELLGYGEEELKNEVNIHSCYHTADAKAAFLEQLVATKSIQDFEINVQSKDGTTRYCLLTANLLETSDFVGYNGIIRDITERKQAEELRKARDVARQSAKMKEQFIASISHEMRTPMNAVLGMSNLIIKTELNQEQYNYISSIKHSSEILLGIINDILEISTLQNGKLKFENNPFDLHEMLANMINVMQYKMTEKDISFELAIDEDVPRALIGDKLRLNQILYNLVGNAVKFTDDGFVCVRIKKLQASGNTAKVLFEVEDSGIGIPKDKLGGIFDTFTRVRTKDRIFEGTGLGLSIAKNLVDQQDGDIGVDSEVGKGSLFHFSLVFEVGQEADIEQKGVDDDKDKGVVHLDRPFRLLLVEDHKMNQLVARKTLERQYEDKIEITIADNGKIAIEKLNEKLNENTFDIILMDIQMPIMDGYETTNFIRNEMPKHIAQTPILAMTAHAHISKDEKFKEYGMDDFVLKPFEPEQLFYKIAKYINKSNGNN